MDSRKTGQETNDHMGYVSNIILYKPQSNGWGSLIDFDVYLILCARLFNINLSDNLVLRKGHDFWFVQQPVFFSHYWVLLPI